MASTLRSLGFELVDGKPHLDLTKPAFDEVVQAFGRAAKGADIALFYYAGHGLQSNNLNFLVPTDAKPTGVADLPLQMLDVNLVLGQLNASESRLKMVILDACRNNPFGPTGLRLITVGLAHMQAPEGTVISFSTQPGNVAEDGFTENSPYTAALVETIQRPGLGILDMFNEVGLAVMEATKNRQQPWMTNSPIRAKFALVAPVQPVTPGPSGTTGVGGPPGPTTKGQAGPLIEQSRVQLAANDFASARKTLTDALDLEPRSSLALSFRGYTWFMEGESLRERAEASGAPETRNALLDSAIKAYAKAFDDLDLVIGREAEDTPVRRERISGLDPQYSPAWRHRGRVILGLYYARKLLKKPGLSDTLKRAIADLEQAVRLDPRSKFAANYLGEAYNLAGEHGKAVDVFSRAIDIDKKYISPYAGRCEAYRKLGNNAAALADGRIAARGDDSPQSKACLRLLTSN